MPQANSTRWCPTPEQLMILEEMYRSGVRTPNASQILQITAHLSSYGKIEGKNVFYWFQNHKARDRQKLRRRLSRHHQLLQLDPTTQQPHTHQIHGLEEASSPLPSPTSLNYQTPPHFFHQEGFQEANPAMNLLSKLETGSQEEMATSSSTSYGHEWMAMMGIGLENPPCCRPVMTLDLFPTKTTGLKDECSTSKSSSCSTSTN